MEFLDETIGRFNVVSLLDQRDDAGQRTVTISLGHELIFERKAGTLAEAYKLFGRFLEISQALTHGKAHEFTVAQAKDAFEGLFYSHGTTRSRGFTATGVLWAHKEWKGELYQDYIALTQAETLDEVRAEAREHLGERCGLLRLTDYGTGETTSELLGSCGHASHRLVTLHG